MKINRPFDQLRELFKASNNEQKELFKYVFEKSDNITFWVIGISISGISIFANNIANIQKVIPPNYLRPILLLLTISVTSGIIYRILYLYFFVLINNSMRGIDIAFSNQKMMDTESRLTTKETFEELVDAVLKGIGDDLSYLIPKFNTVNDIEKKTLYQNVVKHYLKSIEFAKRDTETAWEFFADTYSNFYGINKESFFNKLKNGKVHFNYKKLIIILGIFYLIYILTFIAALFTFVYAT